ncbi:hypothetical protein ACE3MZ_22805 [Paenibacillus sp. WLX1005]|uniref:hypothetical protein n=1 Tax=Paenibacillus sp. WLX1005 TaxID=3243766 RepID=UPI0039844118
MGNKSVRTRPKRATAPTTTGKQTRLTASRKKGRSGIIVATILSAVLLLTVVLTVRALDNASSKVAVINGSEVTDQELSFYMRQLRSQVQNEWQQRHGQILTAQDWTIQQNGQSPLQLLQQRALDEIKRDKALLLTAQKQGLIGGISYADITADMEQENQRRAQDIASGNIVYGLSSFTPESYYSHLLTALRTELKKRLGQQDGDPLYVSDDEVQQYFDQHPEDWTAGVSKYELTRLTVPADQQHKANLQPNLYADMQRLSFVQLQQKYGVHDSEKVTLSPEGSISQASYNNELINQLQTATDTKAPILIETSKGFEVYRLDHTAVDKQAALQTYKVQIAATLQEQRLDAYIQHQQQQLAVTLYPDQLHTVLASFS